MSTRPHHRRSASTLRVLPPSIKVRATSMHTTHDHTCHRRDAVQLPAFRLTTVAIQPTTTWNDVVEGDLTPVERARSAASHTVSPYNLLPEPAHWRVLHELKERVHIEKTLQAADEPLVQRRCVRGTAADRIEASWSLYDAMNQTLQSKPRDSNAALDILKEIARYRRLADVFKQLDRNHDGVVTRDELVACATKLLIPLTTKDADALMAFMDRNRDGTVTADEVNVLVQKFGGVAPSPPPAKSKRSPHRSQLHYSMN
ncbi:hypothetical protein SDRG_07975 [Saprolegnia diclina VS20]|uniref:EF-hand domain-containing protein n=1 Tax=Saprolegnia diclina (strain VS20) TaxID=1156394 RepID=T0QLH3_SAPDV|nr:hypothetical protein SDRG_07975 [Saprolegnia diclina VS20]EQC34655.1 hypothetical protein SDRG_07975 [Saprolegnia diclina VS20]|eukprot:XP_008612061.1 hypothetical protein SDRG_07975 [Saprolegnia diclina VS20]